MKSSKSIEDLKAKFQIFTQSKFPPEPEGLDVIAELDTTSDGIISNVQALLEGRLEDVKDLHYHSYLRDALSGYQPKNEEDEQSFKQFSDYFEMIEDLNDLVAQLKIRTND
ncbi:MAG: hypothetical protein ACPGO5_03335 [Patescibacteria group bacterium]